MSRSTMARRCGNSDAAMSNSSEIVILFLGVKSVHPSTPVVGGGDMHGKIGLVR
jgi:hypothetical protein